MAEVKYNICDIKGCKEKTETAKQMQVIFTTEQTEGRNVKPYLTLETLDLCEKHIEEIIQNRKYIMASGAMGHNEYSL